MNCNTKLKVLFFLHVCFMLLSVSREVHTVTVSVKRSTHCYCQWNAHESPMEINPATPRAYRWGWFLPEEHQAAAASSGWRQTQTQTRLHRPSCHQMRGQWAPSVPHVQCAGDTRNPWGYPSPRWRSPASAEYVCQRQGFHPACCLWHCWTLSCWVQPALRRLKEWKVAVKGGSERVKGGSERGPWRSDCFYAHAGSGCGAGPEWNWSERKGNGDHFPFAPVFTVNDSAYLITTEIC